MTVNNPQVLAIVGSPHRGGNTEILVDEILTGAFKAGAIFEKVILNDLVIFPCKGCYFCKKNERCVHQDDMNQLEVQIDQSDVLVFGTPVYWWGPTTQFKAFLDRW